MTNARMKAVVAALDALYADLPTIACKGECHTTCGPIPLTQGEEMRLRSVPRTTHEDTLLCPVLSKDNRCKGYEKRPLVCRLFGVVDDEKMRCPYGCVPERLLSDREARSLMLRAQEIAGDIRLL